MGWGGPDTCRTPKSSATARSPREQSVPAHHSVATCHVQEVREMCNMKIFVDTGEWRHEGCVGRRRRQRVLGHRVGGL